MPSCISNGNTRFQLNFVSIFILVHGVSVIWGQRFEFKKTTVDEIESPLDKNCTLPNDTSSVAETVRYYHCSLGRFYLDDLKHHILKEIFNFSPPAVNISLLPPELLKNLTEAYNRNFTRRRHHKADDAATRIMEQQKKDLAKKSKQGFFRTDSKAQLKKKMIPPFHHPRGHELFDFHRTFFHLHNMTGYTVVNATLYFFVQRPSSHRGLPGDFKYRVQILRYTSKENVDNTPVNETHKNLPNNGKWDSLGITGLVREWARDPKKNLGLIIRANHVTSITSREQQQENLVTHDNINKTNMFLEVEVQSEDGSSAQRSSHSYPLPNDCSLEPGTFKNQCCRFPLTVDFQSFGWDWIVAPKRYDAWYCAGACNNPGQLSETIHGHITGQKEQVLRESGKTVKRNIGPCCTPHELEELNIIFVDHKGNVRTRKIDNMIVHRCGCK